jgi:fatty acid amide hydrolase
VSGAGFTEAVREDPRVDTQPSAVAPAEALERFGAAELARGIAAGRWSASDVVAAHIARIEAVDPKLNAVVVRRFEAARAEAELADAAVRAGAPLGPLHGVPITIKEQFALAGTPATIGVAGARDDVQDGPLVARLRAAGAIVLGKTNVPQLLIYNEADNPVYGRTNNPWNLERASGGSSGGEAAIIAACGSPLGLGSDIGGSLRAPSHACAIACLKPTTNRLSNEDARGSGFAEGQIAIVSQPGPMARRVEDLVLAMRVLAAPGQERFDSAVPPVPWREPGEVDVAGLRIGTYDDDGFFPSSPAVRRAVAESARALRALGAEIVSFAPPDVGPAIETFMAILAADGARSAKRRLGAGARDRRVNGLLQLAGIPNVLRSTLVGLAAALDQRRLSRQIAAIRPSSTGGFWALVEEQNAYRRRFIGELDRLGIDVLVAPALALPALTHGSTYYLATAASYSMLYNLLGMPAGVVPATRVRDDEAQPRAAGRDVVDRAAAEVERGSAGLPIGVQVVARHWREDLVLAVMAQLERALSANPGYPALPPAL